LQKFVSTRLTDSGAQTCGEFAVALLSYQCIRFESIRRVVEVGSSILAVAYLFVGTEVKHIVWTLPSGGRACASTQGKVLYDP
jgi:hypothetical protein